MDLEAKPVVKNKFWIVEKDGQKVATIQATPSGVVFVNGQDREKFVNFKLLSDKYNIKFSRGSSVKKPAVKSYEIYGFPTDSKPYNEVYNLRKRLPFFTKNSKSKSYYCAGFYAVQLNGEWTVQFCPKSITVSRYPYFGPYRTQTEAAMKIDNIGSAL
jgi:hypothetical protein